MTCELRPLQTFHELFCAQYGVSLDLYEQAVLRHTFYPHARWLADLGSAKFLAADRSFVAGVGQLTRWGGFVREMHAFQQAVENTRFSRNSLRMRVSTTRMRVLFSGVMGTPAAEATAYRWQGRVVQPNDRSLAA